MRILQIAPPGLVYLAYLLPKLAIPSLFVYATILIGRDHFDVVLGQQFTVFACILVHPLLQLYKYLLWNFNLRRKAAAQGARIVPHVPLNGLATVKAILHKATNGYTSDLWDDWFESFGHTFGFTNIFEYRIVTSDPEHIKAILASQFNDFGKGLVIDQLFSLLGSGVFNSDGKMWQFHRHMTRPFFTRDRISDYEVFNRHTDDAINRIKQRLSEGYPVEFQDVVARFTLDTSTEFLFGKDIESMAAGLPYPESSPLHASTAAQWESHPSSRFVHAFTMAQRLTLLRARLGDFWRLNEFWKNKITPLRDVVNSYLDPVIKEALREQKERKGEVEEEAKTVLSELIKDTQDYKLIQDELVNLLVAGRDTTASTLTFAVYTLTQRPDILARLRSEIQDIIGPTEMPTYDTIKDLKYLKAFLNETLRLYPVVPYNARYAMTDTLLPPPVAGGKPFFIPKHTKCHYTVFHMHRRTDLWGPDAHDFDPDRFIDDRLHKYLIPNPFIFLPFNAGPRICLGQQFAYNEMSFFLIRLLQSFSGFEFAEDVQPESSKPKKEWAGFPGTKGRDKITYEVSLSLSVKQGLWVRMKDEPMEEAERSI